MTPGRFLEMLDTKIDETESPKPGENRRKQFMKYLKLINYYIDNQ